MKMLSRLLVASVCILAIGIGTWADSTPTLTLDPATGSVTGPAGSTVGWGFTLTGASSDFAVITGSDFCVGALTSPCSNSFGTYTDYTSSQFLVVGNSAGEQSITESFDDTLMTGLGSFAINPTSTGTLDGYLAVTYDLFSVDPNSPTFDPTLDTVSTGNYLDDAASVTVGTATTPTPEPSTLLLFALGISSLYLTRKRFLAPQA